MRTNFIIFFIIQILSSNLYAKVDDFFDYYNLGFRWSRPNVQISDKINANQKGDPINICKLDKDPTSSCNINNAPDNNSLVFFEKEVFPTLDVRVVDLGIGWDFIQSSRRKPGWISVSLNILAGTLDISGKNNNTYIQGTGLISGYGYTLTSERFQVGIKDTVIYFSPKYKFVKYKSNIIPLYVTGKNDTGSHFYRENTEYNGTHVYTGISWITSFNKKKATLFIDLLIENIQNNYLMKSNNVSSNMSSSNIGISFRKRF